MFFLFEVGLELSMEKLRAMRKDVFGLGTSQFLLTTAAISSFAISRGLSPAGTIHSFTHSSTNNSFTFIIGAIAIGGSLALSSSAFVLQLLKDKDAIGIIYYSFTCALTNNSFTYIQVHDMVKHHLVYYYFKI